MRDKDQIRELRKELHKLNDEYRTALLYKESARHANVRLYYTNMLEQLDARIAMLAERIGALAGV